MSHTWLWDNLSDVVLWSVVRNGNFRIINGLWIRISVSNNRLHICSERMGGSDVTLHAMQWTKELNPRKSARQKFRRGDRIRISE